MKSPGTVCVCCLSIAEKDRRYEPENYILVRGAVVCPKCDCVRLWPGGRK